MSNVSPLQANAFQRVVVAAHPQVKEALAEGRKVAAFLQKHGIDVYAGTLYEDEVRQRVENGQADLLIALGGDGTMLRAGHLCAPHGVPILGINMGHFGFLIEVERDEWPNAMRQLLLGEAWLERRMMLEATLTRQGNVVHRWDVVNEVVVSRGQYVRPIKVTAFVDDLLLARYVADGLIAATPTGSTAYALAAGGPILPPELRNILLMPVAPHLSVDRAVVLSEGSTVVLEVGVQHEAVVSVDGHDPVALEDGDRIHVRANKFSLQFVRFRERGYFYRNLTSYMNWNPTVEKESHHR
ncbi:MAG: NAD(+)/NADH kinase [Chloroflexi bacterium]|nr:NAD(+)/NADH kinase [Chloroflexota bacterium]